MVDTLDPVSTRHGTEIPPMLTFICGQVEMSFGASSKPAETLSEPVSAPPEPWLCNPVGTSFPVDHATGTVPDSAAANKEGHVARHSPGKCAQAADNAYR